MLNSFKFSKAFSLIEILIVLFILAFIFIFASQRFSRSEKKVKTVFDKMIHLNRRLATVSQLHNQTYRWVIQLNSEEPDQYWVEKKHSQNKMPNTNTAAKKSFNSSEEDEQKSEFVVDHSFYSEPETLPSFLDITQVERSLWTEAKTEGQVYIYYYPKGLAQETAIQLFRSDNQGEWTLYLDPAAKTLQLIKGRKSLDPNGGIE